MVVPVKLMYFQLISINENILCFEIDLVITAYIYIPYKSICLYMYYSKIHVLILEMFFAKKEDIYLRFRHLGRCRHKIITLSTIFFICLA